MLSTKDVQPSGTKKTLSPGNHVVKIYDLELTPGYNAGSLNIILRVEGPNLGPEFDGFLKDPNNPGGAKFAGQVGKVRYQQYAFEDKTFDDGRKQVRDNMMLKALDLLSTACGVQEQVKAISANDWTDMINQVKRFIVGKEISVCLGTRIYTNKSGYKENDLFFPKAKNGKYAFTAVGDPNIMVFNEEDPTHVIQEKKAKTVDSFEPTVKADDDFNLF